MISANSRFSRSINPGDGGWYIAKVFKETLLESVGIKEGDMLYEINGYRIDLYGDLNVPWSEDKASLFEFLNRFAIGESIDFVIYRKGTRKEFKFKFEPRYLPPVRMIYAEFERPSIDYEIFGGMIVMPLSLNHVSIMLSRVPDLMRYGKTDTQYDPALIITHILPNSQAFKARVLRPGEIIEEVNGKPVKTLQEFRDAVLESKKTRFITFKTDDSIYAVLSVDKILKEEDMLAARYFFNKSPLLNQLGSEPEHVVTNKKKPAKV